jgi:hypothetical protein
VVSFIVTIGLHVGIVLFITLSVALVLYALASAFADTSWGVRAITWVCVVVSLAIWGGLVKQQAKRFRPHVIRGLGKVVVSTSGCEWGEIAADAGAGLIGLAQIIPLLLSLLTTGPLPERMQIITALLGTLFIVVGWGSLVLRLWLHRRRKRKAGPQQTS